jgi:hypothetical protein
MESGQDGFSSFLETSRWVYLRDACHTTSTLVLLVPLAGWMWQVFVPGVGGQMVSGRFCWKINAFLGTER